ncbi:hypothetical protein SS50377_24911 [Spironucleus salmonicida]|uniref:Uncharacterized protein n=1 Tax=Spironucleus salmonicida TaxID=348837 RepID=V6LGK7_9EUKA|nr:hypothetical protein SS50377_24911 [Spironucleus salmonicida]|eukprot:EST43443.1 Hypothetical protein SS50377_16805 [Spironucleus salmonicida]
MGCGNVKQIVLAQDQDNTSQLKVDTVRLSTSQQNYQLDEMLAQKSQQKLPKEEPQEPETSDLNMKPGDKIEEYDSDL